MLMEKLTTNYLKTLLFLYNNKVLVNKQYLVPITQSEVSKLTGINRTTINVIFKELKKYQLIEYSEEKQGRYFITAKGIEVVKRFNAIKALIGEEGQV